MIKQLTQAVKNTGYAIKKWRDEKLFGGKWVKNSFKSEADLLAHNFLVSELKRIDPSIAIISEEDEASLLLDRPDRYFIIDPIDGTSSFVNGFSGFVTQVAFVEKNTPILAAIYAPVLDLLYVAQSGHGAFVNGKKMHRDSNASARILIDNYPEPRGSARLVFNKFGLSSYVECGSISLKICKVAQGEADLFFKDVSVRDWDIAAPKLVLEESGGWIVKLDGSSFLFEKNYEHNGLVASFNQIECQKIVDFFRSDRVCP